MQRFPRYYLLCTAVLAMTLLALSVGRHIGDRTASLRSIDDWDISELADHLKRAGLAVQLRPHRKDGLISQAAFLTTIDKDWEELNRLRRDPRLLREWHGVVCCKRVREHTESDLHLWGDHCLVAGPFEFFGDAELLARIRAILVPSSPVATS